jgi:hypothetical protein
MPVTVQGPDGQTYQFPDGTDKAAAIGYFKKKGIGAKPVQTQTGGPEARTVGNYLSEAASGVGRGLRNDTVGLYDTIRHPIDTAVGTYNQLRTAAGAAHQARDAEQGSTLGARLAAPALAFAENAPMIGGMVKKAESGNGYVSPESVGASAEGITTFAAPELAARGLDAVKGVTGVIPRTARAITKTGPKVVGDLVKETTAANEAGNAYSAAHAAIETARENALKVGNEKYSGVNEKLNNLPADMEKITDAYGETAHSLGEVGNQPPILTRLGKTIEKGEPLSYKDEQLLYSELGKELSKGTLPGSTYHAYDVLHESLGNDMQRIADSRGAGTELTDARNYWRRMKQTFGKPYNATDAASGALRSFAPQMAEQASVANRTRMLGSFDPEIPKHLERAQKAEAAAKELGTTPTNPGETRKISPESVQSKKLNSLTQEGVPGVRKAGHRIASYGIGLKALWDVFQGNVEGVGKDVATGLAAYKTAGWIADALERPAVVKYLTQMTPADLAQIPPELREQIPQLVKQARARGINVSPALTGAVAASGAASATPPRKGVAAALKP